MVDLTKERKDFEAWEYSMGSNLASINGNYVSERTSSEWFAWKKRAEQEALVQAEITKLKQKLARYENPDYVLVPRKPTEKMLDALKEIYVYDHYSGESSYSLTESEAKDTYKAMIEAVEKDDD